MSAWRGHRRELASTFGGLAVWCAAILAGLPLGFLVVGGDLEGIAMSEELKPITDAAVDEAREQLSRWDAGDSVWLVSLGGIGPGYEQAIQVLLVEIVREAIGARPNTQGEWELVTQRVVSHHNETLGGLSGAQVGMAKNAAYLLLTRGWKSAVDVAHADRRILVSNHWPRANPEPMGPKAV